MKDWIVKTHKWKGATLLELPLEVCKKMKIKANDEVALTDCGWFPVKNVVCMAKAKGHDVRNRKHTNRKDKGG